MPPSRCARHAAEPIEDDEHVALVDRLALLAAISSTLPGSSASTGISIFIDSRMTTVSPSSTWSPGLTSIFQTVPVMCASTSARRRHNIGREAGTARVVIVAAQNEAERIGRPSTPWRRRSRRPADRRRRRVQRPHQADRPTPRRRGGEPAPPPRQGRQHHRRGRGRGRRVRGPHVPALRRRPRGGAGELGPLVEAVEAGRCDLAVGRFANPTAGASDYPRLRAPGGRAALRRRAGGTALGPARDPRLHAAELIPFADGWGMEMGMTIDAVRAGLRIEEIECRSSTGRRAARPAASSTARASSATSAAPRVPAR